MLEIGPALYSPFSPITVLALGRDDLVPVSASIALPGRALMPWSPVHPIWNFLDNGDLAIGWTRRSRAGTVWSDHVEVPLAEEAEKYRVELSEEDSLEISLSLESVEPQVIISSAQLAPILLNNINYLTARIYQIGVNRLSPALIVEIPL